MSQNEHDDLIQGEIDGVNPAPESARLKELIAGDPALGARFGSLGRVAESLARAERLDPPAGFADDVMFAVRRRKPEREAPAGWLELVRSLFSPAPLVACACTLAIGVVLGALLPSDAGLFSYSERAALSGTALSHGRLAAAGALDRKTISLEGIAGEVVTRLVEGSLVVDLQLDSTLPAEVSLDLARTGLVPRSFSQDGPAGGDVLIGADQVRFTHPAGRRRYSVSFAVSEPAGRTLRLRIGEGEGWDLALGRERTP